MPSSPVSPAPGLYARLLSTSVGNVVVTLFVLWHLLAIGTYAIPKETTKRFPLWLHETVRPVFLPYVLTFSQWQQWNLFAPDPLRRISIYRVEAQTDEGWKRIAMLRPGYFSWWRHAAQFKLLGNILDLDSVAVGAAQRYLQALCGTYRLRPDTPIRMQVLFTVIPWTSTPRSTAWWQAWEPHFEESKTNIATTCVRGPDAPPPL